MRRSVVTALALGALVIPSVGFAQTQYGTAAEAKAMLDKVVVAMKADPTKTVADINSGTYRDRDLYPFCAGPDGKTVAHPDATRRGMVQADNKDAAGTAYGAEMVKAEEGKIKEVSYVFPRPGDADKKPVQKIALVTKVNNHVCGVGYYK